MRKFQFSCFVSHGEANVSERCFIELTGVLFTQEGKKKMPCGSTGFTLTRSSYQQLIHRNTHFVFKRKLGAIFKPGQSEDQRAKVHAMYIFLSAVVCSLTCLNPLFAFLTSSSFSFALQFPVKWRRTNLLPLTKHDLINNFSERLLERSQDNFLFVSVQFFLRPSIFTFLLLLLYTTVKTLLLLTVSVV